MPLLRQFIMIIATVSPLLADGFIISSSTYLTPLSVKHHKVTCTIDNGVAATTVDQEFVNNQPDAFANGRYVFPIPHGAVIDQFNIVIDGVAKTATVLSKDTARAFFYTAVKNSNQATLLEYVDNGAYTVEIGSVLPGTSRHIRISYVEVLPKFNNLVRYLHPLNTERFSMQLIDTVSIDISIRSASPISSVYSPSYMVTVTRPSELEASVKYVCTKSRPDRDFDLYYKLANDAVSFHLFPFKKAGDDGYFLMLMTPKFKGPDAEEALFITKDIVFTIDHSGSMAGTKMVQARDALRYCLKRVLPGDFFNIVAFDQAIMSNAPGLLPAATDNVQQALSFVETIRESGSTDIAQALTTSLSRIGESEKPHYCIFLTDGMPTSGITNTTAICSLVNDANRTGTRIFSVGFGYDVNTVLIDKISIDNGGYPLYCSPDQNIETVIGDLYRRIESPILTSPHLDIDGTVATWGISPSRLPDLFSGSEIAVFGRYRGQGRSGVTLSGSTADSLDTLRYEADFPDTATGYSFVPRLWATQQIAGLMTKIKLQTLTKEDLAPLVDSVKALSLAYGIVTPYTSSLFVGGSSTSWAGGLQTTSGMKANDASNFMQGMQQNSNAAQTVISDTNSLPVNIAPQLNQMQNIGNKIFVFTADSVWKDAVFDSIAASDTVYYGSDEYFSLAGQDPDLRKMLTVGTQAAFNYNGKNYLVLAIGAAAVKPSGITASPVYFPANLIVRQNGNVVLFVRPAGSGAGTVDVITVNGSRVAHLVYGKSVTSVAWIVAPSRGVYCAVYRSNGSSLVRKFVVR